MGTVMSEARTENSAGKVNTKFKQFADDCGLYQSILFQTLLLPCNNLKCQLCFPPYH